MADISVFDFGDGVERNIKDATARSGLTGKADKVTGATNGNLAKLDSNGNLQDSGVAAGNVVQKSSTTGLLKNDGTVDTHTYVQTSNTAGLLKNDGTVDTTTYASEAGTESLIDSTVGWTGKNLLKNAAVTETKNGVTFTVTSDGKVTISTVSGGATADTYFVLQRISDGSIWSGCKINGSHHADLRFNVAMPDSPYTSYGTQTGDDDVTLSTIPANTEVVARFIIYSGKTVNITAEPMIRDSRITDPTYEPYHKSVEECLEEINDKLSYLEQSVTLSTSASTTVTFTDSSITANSFIEYACSVWDLVPESITGAAGSCTIVLPKVDSAQSVTVRIYVR